MTMKFQQGQEQLYGLGNSGLFRLILKAIQVKLLVQVLSAYTGFS
jgi:hypothetical protein